MARTAPSATNDALYVQWAGLRSWNVWGLFRNARGFWEDDCVLICLGPVWIKVFP